MANVWNRYNEPDSTLPAGLSDADIYIGGDETEEERSARLEDMAERNRLEQARFRAIAAVYEKADRILTSDPVEVRLTQDNNGVSAWNDGRVITLNTKVLRNYEDSDIVSLHGVNYHEFAHIRYTPRAGSELVRWVASKNYLAAFNMLEDQRIETLLVARYPSTRNFLTAGTLRYVMENPLDRHKQNQRIFRAFPLVHGRRYLDPKVRRMIAQAFIEEYDLNLAQQLADIIDEYRLLVFPKDANKAKDLIQKFHCIITELGFDVNQGPCGGRGPMKNGRPEPASSQQQDAERSKAEHGKGEALGSKSSKNSESGKGHGTGDNGDQDETQAEFAEAMEDQFGEDSENEGVNQEIVNAINEVLSQIESQGDVRRETREFRRAVRNNERIAAGLKASNYEARHVDADSINAAREFGEALRLLEEEAVPMWERQMPTGKLNINRAMNADINDIDKLFDRWYEGSDAVEIEAAVLLDRSGSMAYRMYEACSALWTVKRGLERVNARVTAYTFNDVSRLLYSSSETTATDTMRVVPGSGGTNPMRSLEEVEFIMDASQRATKLLFIVTDGAWQSPKYADQCIRRMQDAGVFVSVIYIGDLRQYEAAAKRGDDYSVRYLKEIGHGADVVRSVGNPRDLVSAARAITTKYLRERIGR